jgi:membrane fusion protein, multidrug efflux system
MKSLLFNIATIAILALGITACSNSKTGDKQSQLDSLKKEQVSIEEQIKILENEISLENPVQMSVKSKEVGVLEIKPRPFEYYIQTQGHVEAEDNIMLSAKSMGVVMQVYVNEGQNVSKGQTIAQIDNAVLLRNIESMKTQLDLVKTVFERQRSLWEQKIGSEVQYLQAKTNMESMEKQLASLQEQNEMSKIKASINGTIDALYLKVGENIAPGMPAARIVNTADLTLKASVSEAYVTSIKVGDKVVVSIPELKKDVIAKITFVGKTIDLLSRTFPVEIKLPFHASLRPNMSAVIKVVFQTEQNAIVVPINAIQDLNGEKIVFVVQLEGKNTIARKRVVTVAGVYDNLAQVSGLLAGEKIITVGYQGLSDGQFVKP